MVCYWEAFSFCQWSEPMGHEKEVSLVWVSFCYWPTKEPKLWPYMLGLYIVLEFQGNSAQRTWPTSSWSQGKWEEGPGLLLPSSCPMRTILSPFLPRSNAVNLGSCLILWFHLIWTLWSDSSISQLLGVFKSNYSLLIDILFFPY